MNNEPVGYFGKDPYGNWEELNENHGIPLYTHPAQELNNGGEPVKNATYWKRQCNLLQSSLTNLQSSLYHANEQIKYLESYPAKTLTDEEWNKAFDFYCETDEGVLKFDLELRDEWKKEQLIRWKEALRKAQEK